MKYFFARDQTTQQALRMALEDADAGIIESSLSAVLKRTNEYAEDIANGLYDPDKDPSGHEPVIEEGY